MRFKVLITSSGTGSRLKRLTTNVNKSLVKVGSAEVILRIINSYPNNSEIIITVGYLAEGVRKFVKKKFPKHNITFVEVDCFEGEGSSLGYSLLATETAIDCPFIFHCNDTLVFEKVPINFSGNWIGWSKGHDNKLFSNNKYSSVKNIDGRVTEIYPKGIGKSDSLHIGLVGIYDYQVFFNKLRDAWKKSPLDTNLNDVSAINAMIKSGYMFEAKEFPTWLDTGNLSSLEFAENRIATP